MNRKISPNTLKEIGQSNRIGFKTILLHFAVSCTGFVILDKIQNDFRAIIMMIITLTLFFLWNNAIKSVIESGLIFSIIVSLYFIVPSAVTGISWYYSNLYPLEMDFLIGDLVWMVINYPFSFGNLIFESANSYNIWIQIFMPITAIGVLVLLNYLYCKRQAIKTRLLEK